MIRLLFAGLLLAPFAAFGRMLPSASVAPATHASAVRDSAACGLAVRSASVVTAPGDTGCSCAAPDDAARSCAAPACAAPACSAPNGAASSCGVRSAALLPSPVRDSTGVVLAEFVYDSAEFPSCHAATIVETARGELMIALFGGRHESNADCSIWISHRRAGGWDAPTLAADGVVDSVKTACWNPVLFQVPDGELLLFYKVGTCVQEWTGWLIRSSDGGESWSSPERLPDGFLGPIKNKPILLDGRLLCGSSLERGGWRSYLEITDPGVTRWRQVGPLNNRKSSVQIIQPSLLPHADGTLQAVCRAIDLRGNIVSLFSRDGGETWSEPLSSGLPNNDSGLDGVALRDGRFLLVYNHIQASVQGAGARSPINVALSDNGRDWYAALVLEDSPGDEYSYPSVIQGSDGLVHIVYTWHRQCIKHVVLDPSSLHIDPARKIVDEVWKD